MDHHCCNKQKVKRGLWSPEEDEKLMKHILAHGHGCWSSVPKLAGLQRCGKSCRLRWINYLRPDLKRGSFTSQEEIIILDVHRILGNRWAQIAKHLPGRTDNEVKNFWNSCIKKKLISQGLDPNTHKLMPSVSRVNASSNNNYNNNNNNVTPTTTINLFTISPSTKSNSMNNISPQLVTTPTYPNIGLHDTMPSTTFQYQDPQNAMQNAFCSSTSFSWENISTSLPFDNSEFMDEACMWGGSISEVDEENFQRNERTYEINEGAEMDMPTYSNETFDIELIDSTPKSSGMFCNESSLMEQLQWECKLGH